MNDYFDKEKTPWERRKVRKSIINEVNDKMRERKFLAEQDSEGLSNGEKDVRESKLRRLDAEISDLKDEISLDVLESLESYSKKLHSLTWSLVGLTVVLATLTAGLLLYAISFHVP